MTVKKAWHIGGVLVKF